MDTKDPGTSDEECSDSSGSIKSMPRVFSNRKAQHFGKRMWWDTPKTPIRRDVPRNESFFEFDLPEHLPSSPMCPASPKYQGKRKVCVVSRCRVSGRI